MVLNINLVSACLSNFVFYLYIFLSQFLNNNNKFNQIKEKNEFNIEKNEL